LYLKSSAHSHRAAVSNLSPSQVTLSLHEGCTDGVACWQTRGSQGRSDPTALKRCAAANKVLIGRAAEGLAVSQQTDSR
jgi:hypothetical protein